MMSNFQTVLRKAPSGIYLPRCSGSRLSGSSAAWKDRQAKDPYVHRTAKEAYRARSAFKLIEIDDRFKVLAPGQRVLDCGAAPGAWTQVAVKRVNALKQDPKAGTGAVFAVDIQLMEPVEGALVFEESDFTSRDVQETIHAKLRGHKLDVVLCDMAPNATGAAGLDHLSIVKLYMAAYSFAVQNLTVGGHFVGKLWQGSQSQKISELAQRHFRQVKNAKPPASRNESAELFIVARHLYRRPNFGGGVPNY